MFRLGNQTLWDDIGTPLCYHFTIFGVMRAARMMSTAAAAVMETSTGGLHRSTSLSHDAVLTALPDILKAEGFGIVTRLDIAATFKAKGVDDAFPSYTILGTCPPQHSGTCHGPSLPGSLTAVSPAMQNTLSPAVNTPCAIS